MIKIAFSGTHSTGKTTLLLDIYAAIGDKYNLRCSTEVARKIIEKGYPLNMDANVDSYIHYINDQLNEERGINECDIFISDRTLLDPLAYSLVNSKLPRPYIPGYFIEMMENIWLLEKERYDFYVYFPIEFKLEEDGIRPTDDSYRCDIDEMIMGLLMKYNIKFITVTGNREKRMNYLMSIIEKAMNEN